MDTEEVRRVLFRRVESLDSENTLKIMGYLLLKGWGEKDMLELAISSDYALQSLVVEAKLDLGLTLPHFKSLAGRKYAHPSLDPNYFQDFNAFSGQMTRAHFDDPMVAGGYFQRPNPNTSFLSPGKQQYFHNLSHNQNLNQNPNLILNQNQNQNQNISLNLNLNQNQNLNINHGLLTMSNNWSQHGVVTSPRIISNGFNSNYPSIPSSSSSEKPCPHFAWGFCKHGSNCRFSRVISSPPLLDDNNNNSLFLSPSSLECLKIELKELLQGRKNPVSIASLPQLYFEKYGKTLQADGYLTESQRHGKSGFSLTKLLSKLNNTVMIIDRPHGQHAVMLIEEEPKLKESGETTKDASNGMNSNSRQIYLTFPAESTFTEEDVIIHFRAYGPVQDVRIPYQQKRMFGFVTFVYSETVRNILVEGNPHYICGARVLVKPYKEKGKINDIKKSREREGNASTQSNGFCNSFDHLARHYFPFSSAFQYNEYNQGVKTNSDATNASPDEQFLLLGRKIEEMKLDQNNNNENKNTTSEASASSFFYHESDEELNPMMPPDNAEDCFHLQSNIFRYVLDILDSDGKEGDFVEQSDKLSNNPISSDLKMLGNPFNYNLREVSDPALKRTEQKSLGTGCNWSEPTLFASSVY